jgi:hypothetical protein
MFCSITLFKENRAVYEIMRKNIVQPDRPEVTVRRMRTACWILKATNTHSEYAIFVAFPLQQRLHERASMLHYLHIACHGLVDKLILGQFLQAHLTTA